MRVRARARGGESPAHARSRKRARRRWKSSPTASVRLSATSGSGRGTAATSTGGELSIAPTSTPHARSAAKSATPSPHSRTGSARNSARKERRCGMKDRMTLGHITDVAESAALTMADGRATGSLRIALGERCFREPSLRSALVRLTFQCMIGSRLPRQSASSRTEMPCRPRGSLRPLRFTRALVFDCAASLRSKASSAHLASRATPLAHYKLRSL